jgi:hypothetical protein
LQNRAVFSSPGATSANGPRLSARAVTQVGSYLRYTGRDADVPRRRHMTTADMDGLRFMFKADQDGDASTAIIYKASKPLPFREVSE